MLEKVTQMMPLTWKSIWLLVFSSSVLLPLKLSS